VLDASVYGRLAGDLRRNGVTVLADVTGRALGSALAAGVDVLKLSDDELVAEGWAENTGEEALVDALGRLEQAGARAAVASRGPRPAIALVDGRLFELRGPGFTAADPIGTGDAMLAGMAVSLARGRQLVDAIAFGMAAGAINATRHGLGTGSRRQVDELARHVVVHPRTADARTRRVADRMGPA
jgi:1-phosphofructokinase